MFSKLFGETEELQISNLQKKVIFTCAGAVLSIIGVILSLLDLEAVGNPVMSLGGIILFVVLFMWGFGAIKNLFGIGTIGALLSGNVVIGVVIIVFCALAAYLISIFIALLGIGRYIYLKVKKHQEESR